MIEGTDSYTSHELSIFYYTVVAERRSLFELHNKAKVEIGSGGSFQSQ